jgi:hypothetical protein
MASMVERFRLRLPSELGCAPGAFTDSADVRNSSVGEASFEGFGVP